MKQLGSSHPCIPLVRLFSPSFLAALLQQAALSQTEGLISVWILAQQGQMCTCMQAYMQCPEVLLAGEGQIKPAASWSLGQHPKLGFS